MFTDPTMAAAINVWGETVSLLRDPAVSLVGVLSKPDFIVVSAPNGPTGSSRAAPRNGSASRTRAS